LTALALVWSRVASAQERSLSFDPDQALVEALDRLPGTPIALEAAVALALDGATDVLDALAARDAALGTRLRESGAFDPELFTDMSWSRDETPSSSPFTQPDVVENDATTTSAGARVRLPIGTEIEAAVDATRLETNSAFAAINPEYRADGRIEIRQPLLKGFASGTGAELTAAKRGAEAAESSYTDARLAMRSQVETTYWRLYAAERDVAVQELIVGRAEALLEQATLRAGAGLVGPNEVANARVFLAEQRLAALDRIEDLSAASDRLATLVGVRPAAGLRYRPADEPPTEFPVDDVDVLLERANRNNHALAAAERNVAAADARARGAKWNGLPELDVIGSLGGVGLSGTGRDVVFGGDTTSVARSGGYGDAIDDAIGREFPNWSVGLEITLPLPLRAGRGERRRLDADARRARAAHLAIQRSLEERVRVSHRELVNSRERLEVAEEGVDASLEQVRIGLIEYENGRTTAFELVQIGADLASAQQRLSEALVRAATASADLSYLTAERR
jgi:outer membrane protein TolC